MPKLSEIAGPAEPAAEPKRLRLSEIQAAPVAAPVAVPDLAADVYAPENPSGLTRRGGRRNPSVEPMPLGEAMFERAQAGLTDIVAGGVRGLGEFLDPASYYGVDEDTAATWRAALPQSEIGRLLIGEAQLAGEVAQAKREAASVGAIEPQTVDELADMVMADPEGAVRYFGGIGAESGPAILAAMATRNPRAAERLMGLTSVAQTFGQQRMEGVSGPEASQQAIAAGLIEAASSRVPADIALGGASLGRRLLLAPGAEAASEASAGGSQSAVQDIIAGREVDADRAQLETLVGAIVGQGMGLGEAALGRGPQEAPVVPPLLPGAAPVAPPAPVPAPAAASAPPAVAEALGGVVGPEEAAAIVQALAPVPPAQAQIPEGATIESIRQQIGQATSDAERRQLAAILGALQNREAPSPAPQPGAELAQASDGETALPDLSSVFNDPEIAAALDALAGTQTTEASAPVQASAVGGSPAAEAAFDLTPANRTKRAQVGQSSISYSVDENGAKLALIRTPKEARGQGQARAALRSFLSATDEAGIPVTLTVAEQDATTTPEGLERFYASEGFVRIGTTDDGAAIMARQPGGRMPDLGREAAPPKLSYLTDQIGWAERGGRLLRERLDTDSDPTNFGQRNSGDVAGRTKWVPKTDPVGRASTFWRDRPMRITEDEAREALRRYDAGERLTAKQQRFVDYAIEYDRNYMAEGEEEAQRMRETGFDETSVQEQDTGPDKDVARAFDDMTTQDLGDVVPFSRRATGDLFGAATTAEQVEAERRRRDAERNGQTGTGRTDMMAGRGDLFAGPRPEQADIETPVGQPGNVRRTMRPPPPAEERAGPSGLEVDAETDRLIEGARQEARRLAADTGEVAQRITRELGPNARRHITVVSQWADLPADVRRRAEAAGLDERTEGFFDPRTGRVFILADERMTAERAVWVAFHETAGHLGLRAAMRRLAGDGQMVETLVREFDRAGRNDTVSDLARAIRRQNPDYGRMRSIEEALSELAAANRTGNWQEISTRYGVEVPPSMRPGVRTMLDSLVEAIRRFFNAVLRRDAGYTDGQVLRLLEDAWRDAQKAGQAARESDAMLSRRAGPELDPEQVFELLQEYGQSIPSTFEAERRWNNGEVIFAQHDSDEDPFIVDSFDTLKGYEPEQLMSVPRSIYEQFLADNAPAFSRRADQTETPEFRRWFGDSKVVDSDGKPLVVYHGSNGPLETVLSSEGRMALFDKRTRGLPADLVAPERRAIEQTAGAMWFTEDEGVAEGYAGQRDGTDTVTSVYLSMQNPLDMTDMDAEQAESILSSANGRDVKIGRDYGVAKGIAQAIVRNNGALIQWAKANGYDGLIYPDTDVRGRGLHTSYVTFTPGQIKSATGNRGTFDPESDNILFSRRDQGELVPPATMQEQRNAALSAAMAKRNTVFGRLAAMGYPQGSLTQQPNGQFTPVRQAVDEARRYLQDRMIPLRRTQESAAGPSAPGVTTPTLEDGMNAYRLENLMHGSVADKMRDADDRFILRIQRMMKNTGVTADQLQDYLLARHAPERNARIASINPAMPDGGSGITTQQANDIMAGTEPGPYSGKPLDAETRRKAAGIAAVADEMRRETLTNMVKAGQITQTMMDTLLERYPNYVPLRGWRGEDAEAGQRTGRGLQAVRNAIKRALGRTTLADNLLGEMAGDLQRSIVAVEKNKVGRAFLRFALANPMPDMFTVEPVELEWKFSESTGEAYLGIRNSAEDMERSLVVLDDQGNPVRIRFEDDGLAQAMVNMNPQDMGPVLRVLGAINRWRSAVLTRYNPGFAPVNVARDALFGLTAIAAEKGAGVAASVATTYPLALRAMWRDARNPRGRTGIAPTQRTWDDWARSFAALGGKTGITRVDDVADLQQRMAEGTVRIMDLARQGKPWATVRESVSRSLKPVADFIEAGNDATENAIRLAVYRQLVLDGTSEPQAAEYAKNVTINFNRKGEWGSALNAVYLFYNAAMQGTHAVFRVMRNPKVSAALGSLAVLQGVLAASMMGDDEDEDGITAWDMVPDYVKRTSLVIPLGWATGNSVDYFALPMPYGFNLFTYGGGRATQYITHGTRPTDTSITSDLFTATMDAFSPVPVTDGPRSVFGETIGFLMGLYGNKDDFGRPIVADRYAPDYVPRALLGRADTPQAYHMISRALAKLGGGDIDRQIAPIGPLDIAPEQIEALVNFATGGVGSIFNRSIRAGEQLGAGNIETAMQAVAATPIANRFVNQGNAPRAIAERYYREAEQLDRALGVLKERVRQEGASDFDAILAELQADEPLLQGVELDRYKRDSKWGRAGEPKLTETGAPRLKAGSGSPMETYRWTDKETEDVNRMVRQLRTGGQTQGEIVQMLNENIVMGQEVTQALRLGAGYDAAAPASSALRNRAIKLVQDHRAAMQQEFIRAAKQARNRGEGE